MICSESIFQLISDNNVIVRTSAFKTLGIFLLFKSIYKLTKFEQNFIQNSLKILLNTINDKNMNVRIKVFWSIANIFDAFTKYSYDETLFQNIILPFIKSMLQAINDHDKVFIIVFIYINFNKVKSNIIRAIGNISKISSAIIFNSNCHHHDLKMKDFKNQQHSDILTCIIFSLIESLKFGSVKVTYSIFYKKNCLFIYR